MLAIVRRCDANGCAFPGIGSIAQDTRVSRSKVIASLAEIEARELLARERQTRGAGLGSNRYTLPAVPPPSALGGLPRMQRTRQKASPPSAPGDLGSAPHTLGVVRQATLGSAPGTPYLPSLPILTAQGTAGLAPLTAPATPSPALTLEVLDPSKKETKAVEKKASRRRKSWTKVPADWEPNARHEERAAELRVDLARAVDKFRRHTFDRVKRNADQAFDNWLEREPQFAGGRRTNGHPGQQATRSDAEALLERRRQQEQAS